ncbi:CoA-transferase family III protein [Mycobacterium parascrofulaceum ATCC BAA-614]|uniref:CoA-transferase family III protein n=1 Tax=Mycobacterium parascrofulaceum ATCC BAA-614 TaxID=525368 RepID=D5P5Y7_9MYCO|nr:CaiB/BaiF CoA-transferase family protein [Mycobacterium parascrofulaceum]EFG78516.1 CoA-transferase family III protein [Mycobacterium parascrofulaceum ATCC BAA-614]
MTEDLTGPLAGIRVLELGNFIAAPTAGRILADFGADVIKVERPGVGDELRRWRLHAGSTSLLFRTLGRNKRSITLDVGTPQGKQVAGRLIEKSDVILENFRPGTLEKWGLGPSEIKQKNPQAVLVRISGYGQTGPYRDRPGFGGVAEAIGGLRHVVGYPDRPPVRVGVSLADTVSGLYAVIGALMGLLQRGREPGGEVVDVALYEAVYSLMESLVPDHDAFGIRRAPEGAGLPGISPSNTFACADGKYVVISGNGDAIFKRLMNTIGRPDLAQNPELSDNAGRVAHNQELEDAIAGWAATLPSDQILAELERAAVPSGPIYQASDILADPHFADRGMLETHCVDIGHDRPQPVVFPGIVPALQNRPGATRWLGPELGAHTSEVLRELGFDSEAENELREQGVI